jgi:predicted enzyme related to lactoylglutathione lyase
MAARPAIHFEIIGKDPDALRKFYGELFEWSFDVGGPTTASVSQAGHYGFMAAPEGARPAAFGIGGGKSFSPHTILYINVPDIVTYLEKAEQLGGSRVLGPEKSPGTPLTIGQFRDPEGNLVGLAQIDAG